MAENHINASENKSYPKLWKYFLSFYIPTMHICFFCVLIKTVLPKLFSDHFHAIHILKDRHYVDKWLQISLTISDISYSKPGRIWQSFTINDKNGIKCRGGTHCPKTSKFSVVPSYLRIIGTVLSRLTPNHASVIWSSAPVTLFACVITTSCFGRYFGKYFGPNPKIHFWAILDGQKCLDWPGWANVWR